MSEGQFGPKCRARLPHGLKCLTHGDVGGHPGGFGDFKGHRNGQMSDATVVTSN